MIYLDAAATAKYTSIDDIVVNTITTAMRDSWQNPSSLYAANIKDKINKCRANIAKFIGAKSDEIYFTSGASESNSWAIKGWVDEKFASTLTPANIITTPVEHKSLLETVKNEALNARVRYCDIDKFGFVKHESLELLLKQCGHKPVLVSICMANNEIGTVQDIKRISALVHKYNGVLHTDATQALGHIPINVEELGVDMMSCSGHKISPVLRGIGFLYKKNDIGIHPLIYGAQENGLRGGTENTYSIVGLNKALEYCDVSHDKVLELCEKRDYFINLLDSRFGCKLNGDGKCRLPNNINVTFPQNIMGESLLYMLDISCIKIGIGSACNSKSIEPSHVLKAIGISDFNTMKTVRFTLPDDITHKDIDYVIKEIDNAIKITEAN